MGAATLGEGFKVGHWTHDSGLTGCTVVMPPLGNITSCDIRGSSPSTRELAHLDVDRKLTEVHAILLTGGSAFGLAAADGVVGWLAERGIGYQTGLVPIPIVPAAVIFDAAAGDPEARPGPLGGRAACDDAAEGNVEIGRVGAGAGANVGKWAGLEYLSPGGLGVATVEDGTERVSALAVVNAVGDVVDGDGNVIAGSTAPDADSRTFRPVIPRPGSLNDPRAPLNTVLAVVTTNAALDKRDVRWLAARGSDGITISVRPAHTRYDGDVAFAISAPTGNDIADSAARSADTPPPNLDVLGHLATQAVAAAIRTAVTTH